MAQELSTELRLSSLLDSNFRDAFSDAGSLMQDLKKESAQLQKQLGTLGSEHRELEKLGKSTDHLRRDMSLLERQINETNRATERFGEVRSHFRKASIGARALRSDLAGVMNTARNASLAIAGIGTAVAVGLRPDEELLAFDQTLAGIGQMSPEINTSDLDMARSQIRDLSNQYGVSAAEIARQHLQLTRNLGFEGAQETITAAVAFETATGLSITDFEEELATARISLGIDTPAETQQFLELLQQAHAQGIKIDNLDLGDLATLSRRTGGAGIADEIFQREFLTTIAFRQLDSEQFGDAAEIFQEAFAEKTNLKEITPAELINMSTPELKAFQKEQQKIKDNLQVLEKYGLKAEDGLRGTMEVFNQLNAEQKLAFRRDLVPIITGSTLDAITRGSEALPRINAQVEAILESGLNLDEASEMMSNTWSGMWKTIGFTTRNTLDIMREQFGEVFAEPFRNTASRFFNFINSHKEQIENLFTGIRDGVSPVISKVWNAVRQAYPDIKQFATEVWAELTTQFQVIEPVIRPVGETIWGIAKAVGGFLKEHPRLVATLLSGVAVWKSYSLASQGISVVGDVIRGTTALAQGHIHRLNATILENTRLQGTLQRASLSIGKVFGGIGRAALGAIPGIGAMGGSLMAAIVPALPVMLPVIASAAGIAGMAVIIYRNWDNISSFFSERFETIRNTLMLVFPPLGLLVGFAGVIRDNWEEIKDFFSTLWETVKLAFQVAFEGIQFLALSALVGIQEAWSSITEFFGELWSGIHGFFLNTPLAPVFEWMVDGVKVVVRPLWDFFGNFWDNISQKAGEVLGWITDKFNGLNEILQKWFGWLRDKNKDLQSELNVSGHVQEDVLVDVKSGVQVEKPTIESPVLQIATPEAPIDKPPIEQMDNSMSSVIKKPGVPPVSELDTIIQSTELGEPASTVPLSPPSEGMTNLSTEMSSKSPGVSMPTKSLENIGLGILAETRKQTLLMEAMPAIEIPLVQAVEMPSMEMPAIAIEMQTVEVFAGTPMIETSIVQAAQIPAMETPQLAIESPSIDLPELVIDAPSVDIEDYIVPSDDLERETQFDVQSAEQEGTTAPVIVEQHNHFYITPRLDQDEEALARQIADILDEQRDTYYVQ